MSLRTLEQGISVIQQGNLEEGARLIKIALKDPEIQGLVRATALMWLAETTPDAQQKIMHYQEALAADPSNESAKQRIAYLMAANLPPVPAPTPAPPPTQNTPPQGFPATQVNYPPQTQNESLLDFSAQDVSSTMPSPAAQPTTYVTTTAASAIPSVQPTSTGTFPIAQPSNTLYRTVAILNGQNGSGTGFFITQDGLVATTRYAAAGEEVIHVELEPGKGVRGRVIRSFPQFDLVFINTGIQVNQLLPVTPRPTVADNTFITAFSHPNRIMQGQVRATRSEVKPDWFPTTIASIIDVGGGPILDDQDMLVGMLTANSNRTSPYVFGLNINTIYRLLEQYIQEVRAAGQGVYCPTCGSSSRAGAAGGFYCEVCGSVLPSAHNIARYQMPHMEAFYTDNRSRPCPQCGSRAGFYGDKCLRCEFDKSTMR